MAVQRAMNPVATAVSRIDLWDNPMGTDGFEFVEYTGARSAALAALFERMGFAAVAAPPLEERDPLPAGRHQLHRQRRARQLRPGLRPRCTARRSAPSRSASTDAAKAYERALKLGAKPFARQGRADGAQHPGHRGHRRRLIYLVDRYGAHGTIYDIDFAPIAGADQQPAGRRPHRASTTSPTTCIRGHMAAVGRVLRAALQLPRDPLLRHRGQADRPAARRR